MGAERERKSIKLIMCKKPNLHYNPALKVGGTFTKSLGSNFDHRLSYRICTVGEL